MEYSEARTECSVTRTEYSVAQTECSVTRTEYSVTKARYPKYRASHIILDYLQAVSPKKHMTKSYLYCSLPEVKSSGTLSSLLISMYVTLLAN